MKKTEAIALAGSPGKLAEILGITRQAVSAWPGEHVPELQLYRLRERKPRWFRKPRPVPLPDQSGVVESEGSPELAKAFGALLGPSDAQQAEA